MAHGHRLDASGDSRSPAQEAVDEPPEAAAPAADVDDVEDPDEPLVDEAAVLSDDEDDDDDEDDSAVPDEEGPLLAGFVALDDERESVL